MGSCWELPSSEFSHTLLCSSWECHILHFSGWKGNWQLVCSVSCSSTTRVLHAAMQNMYPEVGLLSSISPAKSASEKAMGSYIWVVTSENNSQIAWRCPWDTATLVLLLSNVIGWVARKFGQYSHRSMLCLALFRCMAGYIRLPKRDWCNGWSILPPRPQLPSQDAYSDLQGYISSCIGLQSLIPILLRSSLTVYAGCPTHAGFLLLVLNYRYRYPLKIVHGFIDSEALEFMTDFEAN